MPTCDHCRSRDVDKGRNPKGRRAYRCRRCGREWSRGFGRKADELVREKNQFADTGDTMLSHRTGRPLRHRLEERCSARICPTASPSCPTTRRP